MFCVFYVGIDVELDVMMCVNLIVGVLVSETIVIVIVDVGGGDGEGELCVILLDVKFNCVL